MNTQSEEEVIRAAQAGTDDAFRFLYERYKGPIYTYCLRMLRHEADAADATQEAFIRAFGRLSSLDHPPSFRYWLYTIVRNEIFDRIRRRSGRIQTSLDGMENLLWEEETPHDVVVRSETSDLVRILIDTLNPQYREVLLLREFNGFSYVEIAAITGDTEAAIKSRLFKARKALAEKCEVVFTERNKP